jgi:arabinosaccharide transport system substrate-binding protein
MKKKLVGMLLTGAMAVSMLAGCGNNGGAAAPAANNSDAAADAAAEAAVGEAVADALVEEAVDEAVDEAVAEEAAEEVLEEAAEEVEAVTDTTGPEDGTPLELWTFVELHGTFYRDMCDKWNEENPDKPIRLTTVTYPYGDMHQKMIMSLQTGTGAPDICDVEVGQFPNVVAYETAGLVPLNDWITPYKDTMVQSRLDTYAGADGNYYGAPFHVGATLMYYNLGAMEEAGLSQADIDAVKTWDDWAALGEKYLAAIGNEEGKYWTSVDTGGTDWIWLSMAEHGEDWTGGFEGPANVQLDSVKKMLTMQQGWLDSGLAEISPDGHIDLEAGFQNILDHNIVSFPKAAWYMSRFLNYMPEEAGNWYLAPCPVFSTDQKCSVGIGGTGTVVSAQSANPELAAEFICWAKMGEEGEQYIWDNLGFDVCNTALWSQDAFAHDDANQYNQFFRNYPYDVLESIKDQIGKISVVAISPTINDYFCTTTANEVLEMGMDVDEALQELQDAVDLEQ